MSRRRTSSWMNNERAPTGCGTTSIIFVRTKAAPKMTDIVHYEIPLESWVMRSTHSYIRNRIHGIFEHRRKVLEQLFPQNDQGTMTMFATWAMGPFCKRA